MKRAATTIIVLLVAAVASAVLSTRADAALRAPQVPVLGGTLQSYLVSVGESINVLTQQEATQSWAHTTSATTAFTIQIENSINANLNSFSLYNSNAVGVPTLFLLVPGTAIPQAFATGTFKPGNLLTVNRFDDLGTFLNSQTFAGVDPTGFSFALQGPNGTFYTQDARNPAGRAQAVAFQGTGANAGTWWLCFDDAAVASGSDQDFDDCVVLMESVNPTPVSSTSWGQLKRRFR